MGTAGSQRRIFLQDLSDLVNRQKPLLLRLEHQARQLVLRVSTIRSWQLTVPRPPSGSRLPLRLTSQPFHPNRFGGLQRLGLYFEVPGLAIATFGNERNFCESLRLLGHKLLRLSCRGCRRVE